ncbi:MAG: DNA repair protein RecN [Eggerthellaceae bacterium]|nr:DNA repair protein RecN [Eggerthellaceae bacterium]
MIDEIQVQNLALIRKASLSPCEGLTVVTGETGAGKTALLSALKLLMGARASADSVRDGEDALVVSGRFFGIGKTDDADDELVVQRRVSVDGRSRASANGEMVSAKELSALVAHSIDLCGQFEHQQLMKPANHVLMLDAWAGEKVARARDAYVEAYGAAQKAERELERVREAGEMSSAQLDEARFILRRIDEVDPQEGEYEQLTHDLHVAEHAEQLASAANTAYAALSGDEGALDALNNAAAALEAGGRVDKSLAELANSLREAGYVLEDVAAQARDYRDGIELDPEQLAWQQERISQFKSLLRSYGPRMEDVFAARAEAAETISLVNDSAERLKAAQAACESAERTLAEAADALDAERAQAAPQFAGDVTQVMGRLEMGGAELDCIQERLDRKQWTLVGPSSVEFMFRPGAGMQARPLARIASGGEVSRVMLAAKVVLGAVDDVDTLVFDEVDAGVGGAVAVALGQVIADLARTHQVIVVTHLAQVAVKADRHYIVRRVQGADGPETALSRVEGDERVDEIARMLSGTATEASRAHARELLER